MVKGLFGLSLYNHIVDGVAQGGEDLDPLVMARDFYEKEIEEITKIVINVPVCRTILIKIPLPRKGPGLLREKGGLKEVISRK